MKIGFHVIYEKSNLLTGVKYVIMVNGKMKWSVNMMNTVEFHSQIDENGIITVPNEYNGNFGKIVKVILLVDDRAQERLPSFSSIRVNTKGFKFDREFANER